MRILNVSQNYFVVGGMDVAMFALERVLQAHGHEVIPFTAEDEQNLPSPYARYFPPAPRTESSGFAATFQTLYSSVARRNIARLLDDQNVDLVHLHSYFKRLTPAILPEIATRGIPIVQTLHEYRAVCPISTLYRDGALCTECSVGRYRNVLRHRCSGKSLPKSAWNFAEMHLGDLMGHKRYIQRYITVSEYQRGVLIAMGMDQTKLITVPPPVDLPDLTSNSAKPGYVLYFGRLEETKGIGLIIDLAAGLPSERFVVAGDGSRRGAMEESARARGLSNLDFVGTLSGSALRSTIERASCVIIPSLWPEAFGLTCVEALALAVPVVASAIGGMQDNVRDGVNGFLVPPGDVIAMTDRVRQLTANPELARQMGLTGRKQVAQAFSSDLFYRRIMGVYQEAMDSHLAAGLR